MEQFADGWVTSGWSKFDGKWIELGQVEGVTISGDVKPPELSIHDVAAKLNELESLIKG